MAKAKDAKYFEVNLIIIYMYVSTPIGVQEKGSIGICPKGYSLA